MSKISQKDKSSSNLKGQKILYLITQTKWGGAQKYVLELAQHFSKHNQVHIAYGEVKHKNQRFFDICDKYKIKTIPVNRLVRKIDPGKDFLAVSDISKILGNANYNLIHLNSK